MTEDVYAPPRASLQAEESLDDWFYVVSPRKLLVLYFSTVGVYATYWFYRQWRTYQLRFGADIWPIPRAFFMVLFVHSLFRLVEERFRERGVPLVWNHSRTATWLVALLIASQVLDRVVGKGIGFPVTDVLSYAMLVPIGWTIRHAQGFINAAEQDPKGASNQHFSAANLAWIALGLLLWMLVALGTFELLGE